MLKITATNLYGKSMQVTQNSLFRATVAGLNPPPGAIFTADLATKDGSLYNASKVNNRNIIITIYPAGPNIEAARLQLYDVFKVSKYIRLQIETGTRKCITEGYIEDMPGDLWENPQSLQISIICPDPFLEAVTETTAAATTAGTAVTVANGGDYETGATFAITATGACSGIRIGNQTTGQEFVANVDLVAGDVLTLETKEGSKALLLKHTGQDPEDVINLMDVNSEWPELWPGNNAVYFNASAGGANATMAVAFHALYGGI